MPEKIIYINEIGNVTLKKNKRSKNVSISIRPLKGVTVTLPYYLSYRYAINVVERKKDWILRQIPKIEQVENKATIYNEDTIFQTMYRKLIISKSNTNNVYSKITPESIIFNYPNNSNIFDPDNQEKIKTIIVKTLRKEAKEFLPERTLQLAEKYNFKFNKVFIKNNTSLWGSCSFVNNINLNLHLLRLPNFLIDYVIIHELCHTVEKNHGKGFWNLMDSILGNAKQISKELKNYSLQIY